jgi:hypothetical protein
LPDKYASAVEAFNFAIAAQLIPNFGVAKRTAATIARYTVTLDHDFLCGRA